MLTTVKEKSAKVDEVKEQLAAVLEDRSAPANRPRDAAPHTFLCMLCREISQASLVIHPDCGRIVGCEDLYGNCKTP